MPVYTLPPAPEDIADLADRALAAMPDVLRRQVRGVSILVEEVADDETLGELGIENAWELTGLYRGVPLGHKDGGGPAPAPGRGGGVRGIETGEDLVRLVRNVLIHEIAHHFGFSDADIAALEDDGE